LERPDGWWGRHWWLVYLTYLVPIYFVAKNLWLWLWLFQHYDYCLAVRLHGEVAPIEVDLKAAVVWIILIVGLVLLVMTFSVTSSCRAMRTFKEVWKIQEMEHSKLAACQDNAE
jgi:hypothetical protein